MIEAHDHIYLSDLSEVSLAGLELRGKTFYGCRFGPSAVEEGSLAECELVGCVFDSMPPAPNNRAARHEEAWFIERSLELFSLDDVIASTAVEPLSHQLVPYGSGEPSLSPRHVAVFLAFLYLSANHPSRFVHMEIAYLASRADIDPTVIEYLVDRTSAGDAQEKAWVLACLTHSNLDLFDMLGPPRMPRLLRDESPEVVRATIELLLVYGAWPHDLGELLGADAESLSRELLGASDPELRKRVVRMFKGHFELVAYDVARELLRDPDPEVREIAFDGLYNHTIWGLEPNFLLDYEPTDAERRRMLAWEKEHREAYGDGHLVLPDEMTELLESPDPTVRAQALRFLGFNGDERFADAARRATQDQDPQVRRYAVRALRWMEGFTPGADLRILLEDESAEVRHEAESLFRAKGD